MSIELIPTMASQELGPLLAAVYDPATPNHEKRAAEAALQSLARTPGALEWALGALSNAAAFGADLQALFFACSVADEAVACRWAHLDGGAQAAVRATLWRAATEPGGPHFVRQKAAASLAHVACLDWPERFPSFYPDLQSCLADPARRAAGVDLLGATLDHFHSLAQTTSAGLKGRVLSSAIADIKQRYIELQPVALGTLCSLLQGLSSSLPAAAAAGDTSTLALAARTLRALRHGLADSSMLPEKQGISSAALVGLLFEFVGAAQLAPAGGDDEIVDELVRVAAAALDCTTDLLSKYYGPETAQQMLEALLPRLQDTCGLVQARWAQQGNAFQLDDPLLTSFVRLLVQFFTTQLSNVDATPQLGAALQGLLSRVLALCTARSSPIDVLLFLEVWHAVLSYLDEFEGQLWDAEDDLEAQQRIKQAVAGYKAPIMAVTDLLLSMLCPAGASSSASASQPPSLVALSGAPSSGAAMEDWLLSVVAGGDSGKEEGEVDAGGEAGGEEDEYGEELLVPGSAQGRTPFQSDSEYDVWVRHAEGFLGRAIGSFSSDLLPQVLSRIQAAGSGFAAACQAAASGVGQAAAAAAGAGGAQAGNPVAALDPLLPAFRSMDICLRLLTRCSPSFPTRGAAQGTANLAPAVGEPVSGAHAVQCLRTLFQLAAVWLQSVQAIAAATQQQGQHPSTPAYAAAAGGGGGGGGGLAGMLLAGARLYKAAGSLTATWLSQLIAGLVQGSADPDAAGVAQDLVQGMLSSSAALLQAAAGSQLAGWQALLYRAAVWAAESLVSLSSIALSSACKPPAALLDAIWRSQEVQAQLRPVANASLANPSLLPVRASRALWLALSDLALRSWPAQPAAQFDSAARNAAFAELAGPLVHAFQHAAGVRAARGLAAGGEQAAIARHAASVAAAIVQSYSGSPKETRGIVSGALAAPALPSVISLLHASSAGAPRGKASAALLRLLGAALEVLATELGGEAVEQLLGSLVQIFAASGGDPSFDSDLLMMQLVVSLLSQGSTTKHAQLLLPALRCCLSVWDRASAPHAAPASDADVQHVRASALAALLALLRYRWRALVGGTAASGGSMTGAHAGGSLAQQAAAAAAAGQAGQAAAAAGGGEGAAVVSRVLQLLLDFFGAAVVLPAADVRLVLEELYELQVATRLYTLPLFQPARPGLEACLLRMLLSRLYRGAQDELGDSLFALAASNWSEFHLQVLPEVVHHRLGGVGPSERSALLALFGGADLDAHSFERRLLAFLNDAAYHDRCSSGSSAGGGGSEAGAGGA